MARGVITDMAVEYFTGDSTFHCVVHLWFPIMKSEIHMVISCMRRMPLYNQMLMLVTPLS